MRAQLKSRNDGIKVAPGKRSAARGNALDAAPSGGFGKAMSLRR
jgi:hypothetical protein